MGYDHAVPTRWRFVSVGSGDGGLIQVLVLRASFPAMHSII